MTGAPGTVRSVAYDDGAVTALRTALAEEYRSRYGSDGELASTDAGDFSPPFGGFVVVEEGGEAVAGGGVRRHSASVGEIKRLWVRADRRRRGLARLVLAHLEQMAAALGYERIWLETGPAQPEAEALYLSAGYRPIPVYGRYPEARAFEKVLDAASRPGA